MAVSRKRLLILLALAAVIIALFLMGKGWKDPEGQATASRVISRGESPGANSPRRAASVRPAMAKKETTGPETPEAIHFRNFYLRPVSLTFGNGDPVPLYMAIDRVVSEYVATAKETHEQILPLKINQSTARTYAMIKVHLPRAPVISSLRLLAALSGNRLTGTGPDFKMEPIAGYDLPDQVAQLHLGSVDFGRLSQDRTLHLESPAEPLPEDNIFGIPVPQPDLKELLTNLGIDLGPEATIALQKNSLGETTATLSNFTRSEQEVLRAVAEMARADSSTAQQTKLSTQILRLPTGTEWPAEGMGNVTPDAMQTLMARMAATPGIDITTAPTVVTRDGQPATVAISSGSDHPNDSLWSGFQFRSVSQPLGTGSEDRYDFTRYGPESTPALRTAPQLVPRFEFTGTSASYNGGMRVTTGKDPDGSTVVLIHQNQRIDPTGRVIDTGTVPPP